jgi:hypothetical protein
MAGMWFIWLNTPCYCSFLSLCQLQWQHFAIWCHYVIFESWIKSKQITKQRHLSIVEIRILNFRTFFFGVGGGQTLLQDFVKCAHDNNMLLTC